ncbi:MAG: hypothetical protein GX897_08680 [Clostridiales bacterium]|nr:hypothetical protein [Clostridiales bacterium]
MKNMFYCSTGCLISRKNNRNWRLLKEWHKDIAVDAFEFMMLDSFYGHEEEISDELLFDGMQFSVFHLNKEIGTFISDGFSEKAINLLSKDLTFASSLKSKRAVLHLWGGITSDSRFERNLEACPAILNSALSAGIEILIENVPCTTSDPLTRWEQIKENFPDFKYLFDTRFGGHHCHLDQFHASEWINKGLVSHLHISDFSGPPMNFAAMRPILHPGEGIIDFKSFFSSIKNIYCGTVTLESPVVREDGSADLKKLNNTLDFIKSSLY